MNQRLYRSRDERILGGVAGGVADYLRTDPSIIRVLWAILTIFSGGLFFLLYIVMWIVVPEEPYDWDGSPAWPGGPGGAGGPGVVGGPGGTWTPPLPGPAVGYATPATPATPAPPTEPLAGTTAAFTGPTAGGETTAAIGSEPVAGGSEPVVGSEPVAGSEPMAAATPPLQPPPPAQPAGGWIPPTASTGWPPQPPVDPRAARRAERAARRAERRSNRDVSGAVIFGLILVLVGAFFLVQMYVPSLDAGWLWPSVLVVVGVALLLGSLRPGSGAPKG